MSTLDLFQKPDAPFPNAILFKALSSLASQPRVKSHCSVIERGVLLSAAAGGGPSSSLSIVEGCAVGP